MQESHVKLVEAVQSHQKALLGATLGLLLFAVSPRSNRLLQEGKAELKDLQAVVRPKDKPSPLEGRLKERRVAMMNGLDDLFVAFQVARRPAGEDEARALGLGTPSAVGDTVSLLEGDARSCDPRLEGRVMTAVRATLGATETPRAAAITLHSVHEPEAVAAADAAFGRALETERTLAQDPRGAPSAGATRPSPAALPSPPPEPPRDVERKENGRDVIVPNPAWAEWNRKRAEHGAVQVALVAKGKNKAQLEAASVSAVSSLSLALLALERAVNAQVTQTGKPRYAVAAVEFTRPAPSGDVRVYVPLACTREPALRRAQWEKVLGLTPPLLPHLRASPEWPRVSERDPVRALEILDEALIRGEGTLDLFGIEVPERALTLVGPAMLSALFVWYALLLLRLRTFARELREFEAALPEVPSPRNWAIPLVLSSVAIGTSVYVAIRTSDSAGAWRPESWWALVPCVFAALTLVLSVRKPGTS